MCEGIDISSKAPSETHKTFLVFSIVASYLYINFFSALNHRKSISYHSHSIRICVVLNRVLLDSHPLACAVINLITAESIKYHLCNRSTFRLCLRTLPRCTKTFVFSAPNSIENEDERSRKSNNLCLHYSECLLLDTNIPPDKPDPVSVDRKSKTPVYLTVIILHFLFSLIPIEDIRV